MIGYLKIILLLNHTLCLSALRLAGQLSSATGQKIIEESWNRSIAIVEETWNHDPENRIDVVVSSPGHWSAKAGCETPKLWVYLYGLYRTFHYTQTQYKKMASKSSGDCFMFVAVMPQEICESGGGTLCAKSKWFKSRKMDWSLFAETINDTPRLLSKAQTEIFEGRMAYAVINRTGSYAKYPNFFPPYWHIPHSLATASASANNFQVSPSSLVIRGRPDLFFSRYFDISGALLYFASGQRGRHLIFANNEYGAQSDVLLMTSAGAYETDIANALSSGSDLKRAMGYRNGLGHGYDESTCIDDSCHATTVHSFTYANKDIAHYWSSAKGKSESHVAAVLDTHVDDIDLLNVSMKKLDLTASVHLYCKQPSMGDLTWDNITFFTSVYRSREGFPLVGNGKPVEAPWPQGC